MLYTYIRENIGYRKQCDMSYIVTTHQRRHRIYREQCDMSYIDPTHLRRLLIFREQCDMSYIQRVCEKVVYLILNFGNKKIFKY